MTPTLSRLLTSAVLLAATLTSTSYAQDIRIGNRLVPSSSVERPQDRGIRAHTQVQILLGGGGNAGFNGGLGPSGGMTPAQLRAVYNLPSTGGSQIIAIIDAYHDATALTDFNTFAAQFGLPTETSTNVTASTNKVFQVLYATGSKPSADSTGGWELEESLDIEWAHAMAPNAKILLVEAASSSFADLLTAEDAATKYTDANNWTAKEISNSWGGAEFSGEKADDSHFSGSSAVYFASAGDSGGKVEYPATSPYVVSAGGTSVATNSTGAFTGETGWTSGGGGPSTYEARPTFQSGIAPTVGSWRGTPDISFDADPNTGEQVYDSTPYSGVTYGWITVGGTSASSPSLAGIANLAATAQASFPTGSQTLLATVYSNLGSANFRDIVSGSNGYSAGPGWDYVTGVGSCQGLGGLQSSGSSSITISSITPTTAVAGSSSFNLTINGTGFVSGVVAEWNGTALSTTFVSANQVTAAVPAADVASTGTDSVTVVIPGGASSNSAQFTVTTASNPVPVLASISPSSARHGSGATIITLTGKNFIPASQVNWSNGSTVSLSVVYVSSTQLQATISSGLLTNSGTASISVVNPAPGGGTSKSVSFRIR